MAYIGLLTETPEYLAPTPNLYTGSWNGNELKRQ